MRCVVATEANPSLAIEILLVGYMLALPEPPSFLGNGMEWQVLSPSPRIAGSVHRGD